VGVGVAVATEAGLALTEVLLAAENANISANAVKAASMNAGTRMPL